jgi:hypothetical protein
MKYQIYEKVKLAQLFQLDKQRVHVLGILLSVTSYPKFTSAIIDDGTASA